ncbi:MAG: 4Fe-4S dicluster domain-containing protein [Oscillospiraceae bacterium]|jgi:epoxyqueuosine reductase QueG|nr:4Fe-4S dicluster domain-containing protein [Oscillospiraceae bacterium]
MSEFEKQLTAELIRLGADLTGFGDLTELSPHVRYKLPIGISIGVRVPRDIVRGIAEAPTLEYWDYYHSGQQNLARIADAGAEFILAHGYKAVPMTGKNLQRVNKLRHALPHKTVATRAGLGWVGKCAMVATNQFGTAVWFASILTNAPLTAAQPINESRCGACMACTRGCPAKAISGRLWQADMEREEFFDAEKCAAVTRERAKALIGVDYPLCGKCIAVCPITRRYLEA